uniref:Uncharacterized protein n=1 Tax=Meloidogyne floridensis TaxID=298350 RepID=A0A915P6Z2_9BILA
MKLAQNLEEEVSPKQQINVLTKIKQQQEEEEEIIKKLLPKILLLVKSAIPLKKEDNLIVKSPKVERKIPINWREEVAMRAEEEGKYVAVDLNPYERERSHTTTEKRKKLVKRKVNKLNGLNHLRQQRISKKFVKSSNSMDESPVVGHDVFDFRLLRMKLQNRIMGMKDEEELATEAENKRKFELQKQQRELQTNLNIKMAMRKWLAMDKESKQQKFSCRRPPTPINGPIPEWAK